MASSGSFNTTAFNASDGARYLTFAWTEKSQSIASNTTTISWTLTGAGASTQYIYSGNFKVVIAGETVYSSSERIKLKQGTVVASGTYTFTHNNDGTKSFSASAEAGIYNVAVNCTGSGSFTLDTIARKSTLSASNGTLGTAQTLTVTRQASSLTHTITYKCGSASGTIATKSSSTSISWTPPLSLASQNTTGTSVSVAFTITTYSGDTSVGSDSKSITCTMPASVRPSCTLTVTDYTGNADKYGAYIQGVSRFRVEVTTTTSYSSAIASYSTTANGAKYASATFTTGVLTSSGTLTIAATVTDKRGRTGTASVTRSVLAYTAPTISSLSVHRCNSDGTENDQGTHVRVNFGASVSGLSNKNSAAYTLEYKKTSASSYTSVTLSAYAGRYSVTDGSYIFAADTGASYNVRLTARDDFNSTTTTTSVSTAFTLMHWLSSGLGMAIGKISELANVLDIGLKTRFTGGILHPVLAPDTDLNNVRTPNTYVGGNLSTYHYANCPLDSGTFTLEVTGAGETDQVKQRIQSCGKVASRAFERYYYSGTWGDWFCVSDYAGTLLWEGSYYMIASQTVNLPEAISKQKSGIVLVFVEYISGAVANSAFHCFFIPKMQVDLHPGKGYTFILATAKFDFMATKYIYATDTTLVGRDDNAQVGTGTSGATYTNNRFVLRYVIGV